jgi:ribose transport system substrate-binding protein
MGYEGVKILVAHIQGKEVPKIVDTGVRLLTRDNLNAPEIKKLLGIQ